MRTPLLLTALLLLPTPAFAAPPDLMGATLMSAIPAVETCRAAAISRKEPAVGTLSVIIEPGDEGAMVGSASSLDLSNALITCITDRLGTVRLPQDATGHEAVWTLPAKGGISLVMHVTEAIVDPTPSNPTPQPVWVDKLESSRAIVADPTVEAAFAAALPGVKACRDDGKKKGLRADGAVTAQLYVLADQPVVGPSQSKTVVETALTCMDTALVGVNVPEDAEPAELQWFLPLTGPVELTFGRQKLVEVSAEYRAKVEAALASDAARFATCYVMGFSEGRTLAPAGSTDIAIGADGALIAARTTGSPTPADAGGWTLGGCLESAISLTPLPEPDGESAVLHFPFEQFRPVSMTSQPRDAVLACAPQAVKEQIAWATLRRGGGPAQSAPIADLGFRGTPPSWGPNVSACLTAAMASLPDPDTIYYFLGPAD